MTIRSAILILLSSSVGLPQASSQQKTKPGDCSVTINGNSNKASITCTDVDPKIAEQMKVLLGASRKNEKLLKGISEKLDFVIQQLDRETISIIQHTEGPNSPNIVNINQPPPSRSLPSDQRSQILQMLKRHQSTIYIAARMQDAEAHRLASELYSAFKEAGWTMTDENVRTFMEGGPPVSGIRLWLHGEPIQPGEDFRFPKESPLGEIQQVLSLAGLLEQTHLQRDPKKPEGQIIIHVHGQPLSPAISAPPR